MAVGVVAVENARGIVSGWHHHRQNDVAVLLSLGLSHHPSHRLNDIDLRLARLQKEDRVEVRHINSLGEASGVGEHVTTLVQRQGIAQPSEQTTPFGDTALSIHMMSLNSEIPLGSGCTVLLLPLHQVNEVF